MRKSLLVALAVLPLTTLALAYPAQQPNGVALTTELQALGDKKKEVRLKAVQRLGSWGAAAALAAPELGRRVQEDPEAEVANQAALALAKIGPAGARELVKAAQSPQPAVRQRALWALGKMGPAAREALEVLQDALQDPNPPLRALAAVALGEMGTAAVPALGDLCKALRDENAEVRKQAAGALANLGTDAVPDLQKRLTEHDPLQRLTAAEALGLQGADAEDAVPDLARLLKDEEPALRFAAATALAAVGPAAKEVAPQLLEAMKDDRMEVQQAAFQALLRVHTKDVPGLLDAFRKLNEEHHWAAPYVLTQFGPDPKDAVKPLIKRLQAQDDFERLAAALGLAEIGPPAIEAVPALQKALKDSNPRVQHAAGFALGLVQPDLAAQLTPTLDDTLAKDLMQKLLVALQNLQDLQQGFQTKQPRLGDGRLVNRQALVNPQIQTFYSQFVDMHIMISVELNWVKGRRGGCPTGYLKDLPKALQDIFKPNQEAIDAFEPEALPALIRGVQIAAQYRLGFT
jgi:HEAT repeat protein